MKKKLALTAMFLTTFAAVGAISVISSGQTPDKTSPGKQKPAPAPDTSTPQSAEQHPPMPEELLNEFIDAIKKDPRYSMAKWLSVENMRKLFPGWDTDYTPSIVGDTPLKKSSSMVDSDSVSFFASSELVVQPNPVTSFVDWLCQANQSILLSNSRTARIFVSQNASSVTITLTSSKTASTYFVHKSKLADIDFEFVAGMRYQDPPAEKPLERFTSQNESLSDVIQRLCKLADMDFSIGSFVHNDSSRVTLDLRNRTPSECIDLAVRTTMVWTYKFEARDLHEPGVYNYVTHIILCTLQILQTLPESKRPTTEAATMESLKQFADAAVEKHRKNRPTVVITRMMTSLDVAPNNK